MHALNSSVDINSDNQGDSEKKDSLIDGDDDEEPSMLDTFSSDQLARRPSFK